MSFSVLEDSGIRIRRSLALLALAAAWPLAAQAAGTESTLPVQALNQVVPTSSATWDINVGTGVGESPIFPGSKRYSTKPIFFGSISYKRLAFFGPAGLGASLVDTGNFRFGPVFGYEGGRNENSDRRLNGLGNLEPSIMVGAFVSYRYDDFALSGTFRQAVTHSNNGLVGRIQLEYRRSFPDSKIDLQLGPEFDLGSGRYVKTWFGVSDAQALRSPLPVYRPDGGIVDMGAHAILTYHWSENILFRLTGDIREYVGDVADSPIVETKTQGYISLGIGYHFQLDDEDIGL